MESENVQEDPTPNIIHQDLTRSKESFDSTDENLSKSNYINSEKDKIPEMLLDPSEYDSQVGKVNGKASVKDEGEDSMDPEQLSQSSSSEDSSASSDVSSSSSDDENNLSNQNRWSSSVTCKGIKLSVRGMKSSNQLDDASGESDSMIRSSKTSFCEEVKSSRLSDDSSCSDSVEGSPSRSNYHKPVISNCNNSSSPEKDSPIVPTQSPNSRQANPTNFKGSISNFTSSNLSSFSLGTSNSEKSSCNISRNDRRSTDSVGSHLSLKGNDIVFERKLSLSSDSSDSENSRDHLDCQSVKSNIDPNIESNLFNSVKSNSSNSNNSNVKIGTNSEELNELSDSTCVKFNNVNTTRSPEKKLTSPIKENSQDSSSLDRLSNTEEETRSESIPDIINAEQKLNSTEISSFKLSSNADQSLNSSDKVLLNIISKAKSILETDDSSEEVQKTLENINCNDNQRLTDGGENRSEVENSLSNEKFSIPSISNSSESAEAKDFATKSHSRVIPDSFLASHAANTENEPTSEILDEGNENTGDLNLDFKSQDMGMEISSDSSLSSDEGSDEESGSQSNLSELSFESGNGEKEIEDSSLDVMKIIGDNNEREPVETVAGIMKVIGGDGEEKSKETMVDVMKVIGVSNEEESKETMINFMKVIGVNNEEESKKTMVDVMKVIGVNNEEESKKTMVDVMKVIGVNNEEPKETMVDIMKVIGVNNEEESKETMVNVMKVIGVNNEEPKETMVDIMKVIGVNNEEESKETTVDVMKVMGVNNEEESKETMIDIMNVIGVSSEKESEEPMDVDIMKVIGGSDCEMNELDKNPSVSKSLPEVAGLVQKATGNVKQSSSNTISHEHSRDENKCNTVEAMKDRGSSTVSNNDLMDVEKESCSDPNESSSSNDQRKENTTQLKSDSNPVNRLDESLESVKNGDPSDESENVKSSDNILSILSKDLKINNRKKTLLKTKSLLLKQKKDSIKFKKKLKMLKSLKHSNEYSKSMTQIPGEKSGKPGEERLTEYAQYLGLQPTLKFKCCICAQIGFQSYTELREHQKYCQSTEVSKSSESGERSDLEKQTCCPNVEDINQTNFRITRKVYLCSACGTYYENWNLFLHMQEVHQRFICLLCLGMFTMSYKLSDHLILTHGVEVKSFQNLSDFRQAFNCALYVSCTDCGKTFGEADNWSLHHCLFSCNVCNIKNGHLPRCPRNFFVKADETVSDFKLPTKCVIRINPSSCSTTTILPKRDEKGYDIASSFCSVDMAEVGENEPSLEPSDSEKTDSPSCIEKLSRVEEDLNLSTAVSKSSEGENAQTESYNPSKQSLLQENKLSNSPSRADISGESQNTCSDQAEAGGTRLETTKNTSTADENNDCSEIASKYDTSPNPDDLSGNQGNPLFKESNAKEIENTKETSDPKNDTQDDKSIKKSSADSRGLQTFEKLYSPSDMKLILKKSALDNPIFKLNSKPNKKEKTYIDLGTNSQEEIDENEEKKLDSSVFDPDLESQSKPAQSRSITSPINCDSENPVPEPVSSNSNSMARESLDFKNRLNPDSKLQDPSILSFKSESQISKKESEKDSNFETSMESQPSVSDDSRMQYESDSQPDLSSNKVANRTRKNDHEENMISLPSIQTSDSDSNRLSMIVDNNDTTTNSRSNLEGNPKDEKMMIDYEGDNAVDNADTVGQSESNYNSFSSDQGSPLKSGYNSDGPTLASEDVPALTLTLNGSLDSVTINTIVKECVRVSCTSCAFCNHALKIAVHAKELVLHLLAEHRFTLARSEESSEKLVTTLKNGMNLLENVFFNTDSYDSSDKSANLPYDGTFSCFQCPFWTLQHKDLYTHKRKMHQKTILLCVMCKSNFYSYSELLCHMCPGTYQPNDIFFRCCFCHIDKIPSAFRLMVHIRKIHHTCEICLDVSTDQQKLATHMWKHKLHHLCYRCGIAYRNKPDITRHLFWKHGTESVLCKKCLQKKWPHVYHFCIPPSAVVCDECNATFTRTVALRVHKRLHTDEKPYACTQCEEKFISKKILAKHEISHTVKEEESSPVSVEKKESYDPSVSKNLLGITDPPVQIQKTDEKQNIDVDDETLPVIRIKKNKNKKSKPKPMLDLTDLPPLNLSSESDSEPEPVKPDSTSTTSEVKSEAEVKPLPETAGVEENLCAETEEKKENMLEYIDSQRLEVILADHDYCKPQADEKECSSENKDNKLDTGVDLNNSLNSTLDTKETSASDSSPTKRKSKSPKKKLNKSSVSSSSSSSSDTDSSSCSCGPNCSCSSSSSDSTTSTSSDSDSSSPENRRKQEERRQKRRERPKTKSPKTASQPEPVISVENEEPIILESDLDTDITLTDEDFYDQYPQQHANKMLAEKQQSEKDQLMLLASVAPTHTAPSSPVVSAEETHALQPSSTPRLKKKLKTKRKRDETLVPASSPISVQSPLHSQMSQLPSTPSLITKLPNPNARNYMPVHTPTSEHFSDRTLSTGGSGSESESKRSSKRRRVKNRFYGYSSEEENRTESGKRRFKPKKLKKVAARKSETTLTRPQIFNTSTPARPPTIQHQPTTPTISIKPVVPSASDMVRSTLPPVRHRPPSPFSSSDSDDDKLNIDEKDETPQPQPPPAPVLAPPQHSETQQKNSNLYCYCQCPYDEVSEMIACDGDNCRIEWFHFECVGIMVPPKGQWFCPDCRKNKNLSF